LARRESLQLRNIEYGCANTKAPDENMTCKPLTAPALTGPHAGSVGLHDASP
jgi:hypothetical protein